MWFIYLKFFFHLIVCIQDHEAWQNGEIDGNSDDQMLLLEFIPAGVSLYDYIPESLQL